MRRPTGPNTPVRRGGELTASLRSDPRRYSRYFEASAAADLVHAPHPGAARSRQSAPPMRSSRYWRKAGRPPPTASTVTLEPPDGRDVLGWHAIHVGRRALLVCGRSTPSGNSSLVVGPEGWRPGSCAGDRRRVRSRSSSRSPRRSRPASGSSTTCRSCRSTSSSAALTARDAREQPGPPGHARRRPSAGLGPFVLAEHQPGRALVFDAESALLAPRRRWRPRCPYLDRLIGGDHRETRRRRRCGCEAGCDGPDVERRHPAGRLSPRFKRLADRGPAALIDGGIGLDPNVLWFNLKPPAGRDPNAMDPQERSSGRRFRSPSIARPLPTPCTSAPRVPSLRSDHAGQRHVVRGDRPNAYVHDPGQGTALLAGRRV